MSIRDFTLTVSGVRIEGVEAGEGEAVVFLHGWAASLKFWRRAMEATSPRYRSIAFDWPGFGSSEKPDAPYTIEWFAEILEGVLEALGISQATLVGHSMGGGIALKYALGRPGRVKRLALIDAAVQGRTALPWRKRLAFFPFVRFVVYVLLRFRAIRRLGARSFTHASPLDDELLDGVLDSTYASLFRPVASIAALDLKPHLRGLDLPTLVVWGGRDRVLLPTQFEIQREGIPNAVVEWFGETGHCPMVERPDRFNTVLLDFLARP